MQKSGLLPGIIEVAGLSTARLDDIARLMGQRWSMASPGPDPTSCERCTPSAEFWKTVALKSSWCSWRLMSGEQT
jgi:hypothetical protein